MRSFVVPDFATLIRATRSSRPGLRARFQERPRRPDHLKRADGVDAEDALEIFRRQAVQIVMRHVLGGAGIVDQHVEPAPGRGGRGDLLAILVAGDVALHHDDFRTCGPAEVRGRFGLGLAVGIIDDDTRTAFGQNGRGRSPEPGCRTRYNRAQTILRHPHFLFLF